MTVRLSWIFVFAFALAITRTPSAATINVGFSPIAQTTTFGNSVAVDLFVSGLAPNISVGSFDVFVRYDPNIVRATQVSFGPFLGNPNFGTALTGFDIISIPGQAEIFEDSLLSAIDLTALQDPVRNSGFSLTSITFFAEMTGTSPLSFAQAIAADANGVALEVLSGNGSITVVSVPMSEPGALSLLMLMLLVAAVLYRAKLKLRTAIRVGAPR